MKHYQIKTTLRGTKPPEWFRVMLPSGMTFSQLYLVLDVLYGFGEGDYRFFFGRNTPDQAVAGEFIDGEPFFERTMGDKYDAAGTYIDTLLQAGHSYTLIAADGTDLQITVEKIVVSGTVMAPHVCKLSSALIDRRLKEKKSIIPDELIDEKIFEPIVKKEQFFHTYSELKKMLASGQNAMIVSRSPKTPEDRRSIGTSTLFKKLADMIMEKARLEKQIEDDDEAWLDNPFLSELFFGENGRADEWFNTKDVLSALSSRELQRVSTDLLYLNTADSIKKELTVDEIATWLLEPANFKKRVSLLDDDEIDFFKRLIALNDDEIGILPANNKEKISGSGLEHYLLAWEFKSGEYFVPVDQAILFKEIWNNDAEELRQKHLWMDKCQRVCGNYYGVLPWEILEKLYARKYKNADPEEVKTLFRDLRSSWKWLKEVDGRLVVNGFEEDNYYKYVEEKQHRDKPYYIPGRKEIEEYCEKGCIMSRGSYQAMQRYLMNKIGCSKEKAEKWIRDLYYLISDNEDLQKAFDLAEKTFKLNFESLDDANKFVDLYFSMSNDTNLISNRGWTPNELGRKLRESGKNIPREIVPASPEAASMLGSIKDDLAKRGINVNLDPGVVQPITPVIKKAKIGRNEPCPCGSGKKYKNCCGRN